MEVKLNGKQAKRMRKDNGLQAAYRKNKHMLSVAHKAAACLDLTHTDLMTEGVKQELDRIAHTGLMEMRGAGI